MARRRGSRQTKYRRRRIHYGRLCLVVALCMCIGGSMYLMGHMLLFGATTPLLPGILGPQAKNLGDTGQTDENNMGEAEALAGDAANAFGGAGDTNAAGPIDAAAPAAGALQNMRIAPVSNASLEVYGFSASLQIGGEEAESFQRRDAISFGGADTYGNMPGILTFGGNHYRNTFSYGTATSTATRLTQVWEIATGKRAAENREAYGTWSGTGWTGMPLLAQWPEETKAVLGIEARFKSRKEFVEVIYPALDGKIYFMELEGGEATRPPMDLGVIMGGTAALDPRGYPFLYVGQSFPKTEGGVYGSWLRVIDLIKNEVVWSFGGKDRFAHRSFQAYTASPLIDKNSDTLLLPGENGILYTVKLNTAFDAARGEATLSPGPLEKYRYSGEGYSYRDSHNARWIGVASSPAIVGNNAFFTDNGGRLQCVDTNTLKLNYVVDVTDDSDGTIVVEEDAQQDAVYLYTANAIDRQPKERDVEYGLCYHRKIDGSTGEILWEKPIQGAFSSSSAGIGGTISTPHVGRGAISELVIFNAARVLVTYEENGEQVQAPGGLLIAYNKQTGEEVWRVEQKNNFWSSPVVLYDEGGNALLVQGDRDGILRLYDPQSGAVRAEMNLGSAIESTPAVFGNMLVVGTRGTFGTGETQKIVGIRIG